MHPDDETALAASPTALIAAGQHARELPRRTTGRAPLNVAHRERRDLGPARPAQGASLPLPAPDARRAIGDETLPKARAFIRREGRTPLDAMTKPRAWRWRRVSRRPRAIRRVCCALPAPPAA